MDIRLSAINLYPVKSIRGISVDHATVAPEGLVHDRRWVIVDMDGRFLTQRSVPQMALITGTFDGHNLCLGAPGLDPLDLHVPDGSTRLPVTVWKDTVEAAAAETRADEWLSHYLKQPCRLVYMDDRCRRPISSSGGRPGEAVSFADGYPVLMISSASLAELNSRLSHPLPMDRFRPNLVVEGCEAFAEDHWRRIAVGESVFRYAGRCARCSVTTVDQATGLQASNEPLKTLATFRSTDEGVVFGVNLVPENSAPVRLGDPVVILD